MNARSLFLMIAACVPSAAFAQDHCTSNSADLMTAVNQATSAFSAMNRELFQEARDEARRALTCVDEPLSPASAAAYHRMEAYAAFFDKDEAWGMASFRAALSIQPAYQLDANIAPEDSPVDRWYQKAQEFPPISFEELDTPETCSLLLDGAEEAERQVELPIIAQVLEWNGEVRWSGLLQPGEIIPEEAFSDEFEPVWPPVPVLPPQDDPIIDDRTPTPKRSISPLWFGAGGAALAAGGLYAASWAARTRWQDQMDACAAGGCWDDPEGAYEESEALRRRTNGLAYASMGVGALTVGLSVGAVFTVEF
jgi:hypothetical protein